MKSLHLDSGVLFVLIYFQCVGQQDVVGQEISPAVGDIYLEPADTGMPPDIRKVKVFLPQSPGTEQQIPEWGHICMNGIGNALSIGTVICRQFGHTSGRLMPSPAPGLMRSKVADSTSRATDDAGVWLRGVDCGPPPPNFHHIFRCKYNVTADGSDCEPAYVRCDVDKLTDSPYHGQVHLCRPQDFIGETWDMSTSTGLVLLYLQSSWGTINYNKMVASGDNEMDSICRQLGFTRSNFPVGLVPYDSAQYGHCYQSNDQSMPFASVVWLTADDFDCKESKACSGCCYRYPPAASSVRTQEADLQLSCIFDPGTKDQNSEGNSFLCSFNDTRDFAQLKSSACAAKGESSIIIVGCVLGAATLVSLLLALAGCIGYVRVRRRQHGERQPLLGQQAQPQQQHDEAGN